MKCEDLYAMCDGKLEKEVVEKLFELLDQEVKELDVESDGFHQRLFDNLERLFLENKKDNIEE